MIVILQPRLPPFQLASPRFAWAAVPRDLSHCFQIHFNFISDLLFFLYRLLSFYLVFYIFLSRTGRKTFRNLIRWNVFHAQIASNECSDLSNESPMELGKSDKRRTAVLFVVLMTLYSPEGRNCDIDR